MRTDCGHRCCRSNPFHVHSEQPDRCERCKDADDAAPRAGAADDRLRRPRVGGATDAKAASNFMVGERNPGGSTRRRPVAYGQPEQVAVYIESVTRLLEREPSEVFADPAVCDASDQFSNLLARRRDHALAVQHGSQP